MTRNCHLDGKTRLFMAILIDTFASIRFISNLDVGGEAAETAFAGSTSSGHHLFAQIMFPKDRMCPRALSRGSRTECSKYRQLSWLGAGAEYVGFERFRPLLELGQALS